MGEIRVGCIPVRQAIGVHKKKYRIRKFIKNNKIGLIIGGVSLALISIYTVLIVNFINLIRIIY